MNNLESEISRIFSEESGFFPPPSDPKDPDLLPSGFADEIVYIPTTRNPYETFQIPNWLLNSRKVVSPVDYEGSSDRFLHYKILEGEVNKRLKERYGFEIPVPRKLALTHNLWREWIDNGQAFSGQTQNALSKMIEQALERSETGSVAIRHAYWEEGIEESKGNSYMDIRTVEEAMKAIESQYQDRLRLGWHNREDVEVVLNFQEFQDPPGVDIFTNQEEQLELAENSSLPIGIVLTTDGDQVKFEIGAGDNRSVTTGGSANDVVIATVGQTTPGLPKGVTRITNKPGFREFLQLDRDNTLVDVLLPPQYRAGGLPIDLHQITRAALVASVASEVLTEHAQDSILRQAMIGEMESVDVNPETITAVLSATLERIKNDSSERIQLAKVLGIKLDEICVESKLEMTLGKYGFNFNQLSEYTPPEEIDVSEFEGSSRAICIISSLEDIESLSTTVNPEKDRRGAIVIDPNGEVARNTNNLSLALSQINKIIESKLHNSQKWQRDWWSNVFYIFQTSGTEHRMVTLARQSKRAYMTISMIPEIQSGDRLEICHKTGTNRPWIRNEEVSGDGIYVMVARNFPNPPRPETIGHKARSLRLTLSRENLPTPASVSLTDSAFAQVLKNNRLESTWKELARIEGKDEFMAAFAKIYDKLRHMPPEIINVLEKTLSRQLHDWEKTTYVVRSSSPFEDQANGNNFAGAFDTFFYLEAKNGVKRNPGDKPKTLSQGILSVMASAFTPEVANLIWEMPSEIKESLLRNWTMPVLIMEQVDAAVSGTVFGADITRPTKMDDYIIVQAQAGLEGGVDRERNPNPLLSVRIDSNNQKIIDITISENGGVKTISPNEIAKYFGDNLTIGHITQLAKTASLLRTNHYVPHDTEWAIDRSGNILYLQSRPIEVSYKK